MWSISSNMRPPTTHHQYHQFATTTSYFASSSWNSDNSQSWSQALVGSGLIMLAEKDTNDKQDYSSDMIREFHGQPSSDSCLADHVKQENKSRIDGNGPGNSDIISTQHAKTTNFRCLEMINSPSADPKSCATTWNSHKLDDFSHTSANMKRPHHERAHSPERNKSYSTGGAAKKARVQHSPDRSTIKVRKEKLGDRITALHQLVSPFGKTDTASVLLEAIGYIRFLQNQIEALSQPYMDCSDSGSTKRQHTAGSGHEAYHQSKKDLRSRGLCVVPWPIECTLDVGGDNNINGADYWASAFGAN